MFTQSSKFYWKKQLMMLLVLVVVAGGIPVAFAPKVAKAADSVPNLIVDYEFRDPGNGELPVDKLGKSELKEVYGPHTHNGKTRMYGNATKGYGTDSAGSYWHWTALNEEIVETEKEKGGGFTLDIKAVDGKNISRSYSVGVRFSYDKFNPNWTKIIDYKDKTTTEGFYFTGNGDRKLKFFDVGNAGVTAVEPGQIIDIIATRNDISKMFTAYMIINGEFRKEFEIYDPTGKATPIELEDGTIRFGFFHDDLPTIGVERPESGKVYSIKFWDGAITPAKILEATAVKGTEAGTKITATPESGNSLMVLVSDTLLSFPLQGEDVPAGAQEYTPGSDLKDVDANTNKYVGVYEVDSNGKIVGFKLITLTANEILPPAPGGVREGLISWVDVGKSAVKNNGNVTELNDLAFEGDPWKGTESQPQPYNPATINFNPGITITPEKGYFSRGRFGQTDSAREIFSVQNRSDYSKPDVFPWEFGSAAGNARYGANNGQQIITSAMSRTSKTININSTQFDLLKSRVLNVRSSNTEWALSLDGQEVDSTNTNQVKVDTPGISNYYIGAGHMSRFTGSISEVILYNRTLDSDERQKVNSYLALKYGLTLKDEDGQPTDYVDSAENLMWSKENIGDYTYRITGIGKDTAGGLEQRQSKSQENGALVTIALGDELAPSNEEATHFPEDVDNTYLTFSDNNESTDYQLSEFAEPVTGHKLKKMDRVFKTQKSDNWPGGNVTLKLDVTPDEDVPVYNYYLLTSSDGITFNNPPVELKLNDKYEVTLDSENLQYFTFAKVYKEDLKALVEGLQPYDKEHYTTDSWNAFDTAKTNAETILAKGEASQKEVDDARDALQAGVEGLTLKTPQTAALDISAKTITIPFDYDVTLSALEDGFTVKIDGQEPAVEISNITFDPASKTLTIALPADVTLDENSKVTVDYQATNGNVKGPYDKAVGDFTLVAEDPFAAALQIEQPDSKIVNDKKPTISGTAEQGSTVIVVIKQGDTVIAESEEIVATDGTWSFEPSVELESGDYIIEVTASNNGKSATKKKELTVVDKSVLQARVTDIQDEKLVGTDYTPESWKALQDALTEAEKVLGDDNASNEDVTKALEALNAARDGLEKVTSSVDKTALKQKAEEINGKITAGELTESDYTLASWSNLERDLAEANRVLNDPRATQDEVDKALADLQQAEKDLVKLNGELKDLNLVGLTEDGEQKDIKLTPDFDPNQYKNYYGTVTNDVYAISLDPKAKYPDETQVKVYVNGKEYFADGWNNLPLVEGKKNEIKVVVYDKNGNPMNDYVFNIVREGAETANNKLESLVPSVGSLYPAFDPNRDSYTMSVSNSVYRIQFTPTALDPNATIQIRVNGGGWKEVPNGELSDYLALNVGTNTIVVRVTDQDGKFKDYTVMVTRASGSTGGSSNSGSTDNGTTTPSTPGNNVKPGDILSTVDGSKVPFATGTVTQTGDRTQTTVTIDRDKLSGILANGKGQKLGIGVPGDGDVEVRGLTAEDLKKLADTGSSLDIENLLAVYPVPAGQLDLNAISKQFGKAPLGDIAANIKITRSADDLAKLAREKAEKGGYELLVHPVDLDLTFTHDGQTDRAGLLNGYAVKYIALPEGVDPNRITTGVIVNPDGTVFHVPTVVTKINNRYFAKINDLRSSGTYSVIWNPKDFNDVKNHWAKASANDIGARLVIEGTGNNNFTPDRDINRSEFAVFIVKGLGLMRQDVKQNVFHDVSSSAWYQAAVTIANEFGIVLGYDDGAFHGERYITREQGMAMIARGYKLIRPEASMSEGQVNAVLSTFGDANQIAPWAKEAVALLISEGITEGKSGQLLKPQDRMTRAEAAALIQRMLKTTDLID